MIRAIGNLAIFFKNNNNNYKSKTNIKTNNNKEYFHCHKLKYYIWNYNILNIYCQIS